MTVWTSLLATVVVGLNVLQSAEPEVSPTWRTIDDANSGTTAAVGAWSDGFTIMVRCQNDAIGVYILGKAIGSEATSVEHAFNGDEPTRQFWGTVKDGAILTPSGPEQFSRQLLSGKALYVGFAQAAGGVQQYRVNLPQDGAPVGRVLRACGRPETYEVPVGATLTNPTWVQPPRPREMSGASGFRSGFSGKVTLRCLVRLTGRLDDCIVIEDSTPGHGFAVAALEASAQALMSPASVNGQPIDGATVNFSVNFVVKD